MIERAVLYRLLPVLLLAGASLPANAQSVNRREVKHIIMMVPDGMGLANVTATRLRLNGPGGAPLHFETLEHIGYQSTYSKTNTVTDSSAAASAFACGEKFVNNEVCFHADRSPYNPSRAGTGAAERNGHRARRHADDHARHSGCFRGSRGQPQLRDADRRAVHHEDAA